MGKKDEISLADMNGEQIKAEFRRTLQTFIRSPWEVLCDGLNLLVDAFLSDHTPEHPREKDYMQIIGKYSKKDAENFGHLLACVMAYMQITDEEFLANMWMEYAADAGKGQFFTPPSICGMIAEQTFIGVDWGRYTPDRPCRISDPACGAGLMLVYAKKKAPQNKLNSLFFHGVDIDINVCHAAALNMLFFNCESVIIHGNALTMEVWHVFRTVHSIFGGRMYEVTDPDEMRRWMEMGFSRDRKTEEIHEEKRARLDVEFEKAIQEVEDATEAAPVAIESETNTGIPSEEQKPVEAQETPTVKAETSKGQLFLF
jgi:hypothetical protein